MRRFVYLLVFPFLFLPFFEIFPVACSTSPTSPVPTPTPSGPSVTTFAGSGSNGSNDGTGTGASFFYPAGIAVDASGNVYVGDRDNHIVRKITSGGAVTTLAGSAGVTGAFNATGSLASFYFPWGVAVDTSGNVYIGDTGNYLVRAITSGAVVGTLAGSAGVTGANNATGTSVTFNNLCGVAIDTSGNVYVADRINELIRKITPGGAVTTLAGSAGVSGFNNATGTSAVFNDPFGVAVDTSGNVYVADASNNMIRKITSGGVVSTVAGSAGVTGSINSTGTSASFNFPTGVAVDTSGNIFVADSGNNLIRKIIPSGVVSTLAGQAGVTGATNGLGTAAKFNSPNGVAVDSSGNIYVADSSNDLIRKIH